MKSYLCLVFFFLLLSMLPPVSTAQTGDPAECGLNRGDLDRVRDRLHDRIRDRDCRVDGKLDSLLLGDRDHRSRDRVRLRDRGCDLILISTCVANDRFLPVGSLPPIPLCGVWPPRWPF